MSCLAIYHAWAMARRPSILVVDDEPAFRDLIISAFAEDEVQVDGVSSAEEALVFLGRRGCDLVLLDLGLPGMDGMTLIRRLRETDDAPQIIILTGQNNPDLTIEAMHLGIFHFLNKPVDISVIQHLARKALEHRSLAHDRRNLSETLRRAANIDGKGVVVVSEVMRKIFGAAREAAQSDLPVLIEGETGVGKEVVARYIHDCSPRSKEPFNVLNCGALTESLVDNELFGHEKGAFTGAQDARPGIIEVTDGGTLLLDEIGDIAAPAQVRLLRVLENGMLRRVGGQREIPVDVRILAATHRSLSGAETGRFRRDLFHRLAVLRISIPPLRERVQDIVPLAEYLMECIRQRLGQDMILDFDTHEVLRHYTWPGNVRELRNAIERAALITRTEGRMKVKGRHFGFLGPAIIPSHSVALEHKGKALSEDQDLTLKTFEIEHVKKVVELCGGNRKLAAKRLGLSERSLYRRL
jgi:DNA-binding NtrC family response regulator